MTILNGYQPAHVVRYFEEICAIPHPSHHEQALCAYIRGCAERYGHRYVEDAAGNLMVYLNATPGYEDKAPMLLQAHMDMVSAKEPGSNHNFLTDPIRLHIEDGHYLYADDTTLGADNAVGLVNMLALMEDDTVVHPPMELLFTVCEEDGMEGIRQLDMSTIHSRRMLNMDCGDPDVMCVSCAGFVHYVMRLPVTAAGAAGQAYTLQIDGLAGGHSGLMIGTGRASAVVLMGRVLCELLRKVPCRIVSVDCERTMGIAPHMQAEIVLKPEQEPDARKVLEDLLAALREEYANTDPELSLTLEPLGHEADQAMDEASGRRCAELMYLLPYGVMKYDGCDRDVILNSVNTVRVTCENGMVEYEQMIRSPIDAYKWELVDRLRILAELTGASLVVQDSYAGWPFRKDSPLQQLCCQVYNRLTGQELKIEKLNSCAETGEIAGAIPDMDIVALAPWGRGAHTPREHLDLDTLQPFWEFLTALLRAMCEEA